MLKVASGMVSMQKKEFVYFGVEGYQTRMTCLRQVLKYQSLKEFHKNMNSAKRLVTTTNLVLAVLSTQSFPMNKKTIVHLLGTFNEG